MSKTITVKLKKSVIGKPQDQQATVLGLGSKKGWCDERTREYSIC